jgi:hypothetical protein
MIGPYPTSRLLLRKVTCCTLCLVFLASQSFAQGSPAPQAPAPNTQNGASPSATTDQTLSKVDPKAAEMLNAAKAQGFPLAAGTVADNVSVEAVLLPAKVCNHVFGKEIAQNYAAVEITISNRSSQDGLILHSVFIDYSQWALSGSLYLPKPAESAKSKGSSNNKGSLPSGHNATQSSQAGSNPNQPSNKDDSPDVQDATRSYQAASNPNQISSVEYRVARGDLLDAQPWTTRNWVMRALVLAGAIASAYAFSINEQGIVRGIAAFSGQVVPGAETFWPDGTVGQMNRISDLGFQVNKVIPKNSSDIVVAFFPLDRFLTPGLRKLYLKSPALFFAPYALVLDKEARMALAPIVADFMPRPTDVTPKQWQKQALDKADQFLTELSAQYMQDVVTKSDEDNSLQSCKDVIEPTPPAAHPLSRYQTCIVTRFLAHASLNTVHVVIDGDMTVNADQVPASIVSIDMDGGNANPTVWTTIGDAKGVVHGSRLTGGTVTIAESDKLGIGTILTDDTTSSDTALHFTLPLTKAIASGQNLTFKVVKKDKQNHLVESGNYIFPVEYPPTAVTDAIIKNSTLMITGVGFADSKASPLTVLLAPGVNNTASKLTLTDTNFTTPPTATEVDIDLSKVDAGKPLASGCWIVKAQIGGTDVANSAQFLMAKPNVTCAAASSSNIVVQGTDLLDPSGCKPAAFAFTLINKSPAQGQSARTTVAAPAFDKSNTKVTFKNPDKTKTWQVEVKFNGAVISSTPMDVKASCP